MNVNSLADVTRLALTGNPEVSHLLRLSGQAIGEVLVASVSLLNPSVIVIGGKLGVLGDHILTSVREIVYSRSAPLATRDLRIARTKAGDSAPLIGASVLGTTHLLSHDYIQGRINNANLLV